MTTAISRAKQEMIESGKLTAGQIAVSETKRAVRLTLPHTGQTTRVFTPYTEKSRIITWINSILVQERQLQKQATEKRRQELQTKLF